MPLLLSDYRRRLSSRLHRLRIALRTRGWRGVWVRSGDAQDAPPSVPFAAAAARPAVVTAPGARRILVADVTVPRPDRDSGSVRALNLMRAMRERGDVVDFLPGDGRHAPGYVDLLRSHGIEVHGGLAATWSALLRDGRYDAVVACRYHLAEFLIPIVRRTLPHATVVLDTVDLHHLRETREARVRGDRRLEQLAAETRRRELGTVASADTTWVVSPVERELLLQALPRARVVVLPNIVQAADTVPGFDERDGLLFIGGARHPPNLDAVRWLLAEIFPRVRARIPDCALHIVGAGFREALADMAVPQGTHVHGFVPEIEPLLARCRIGVAPLRFGAGVKGKINSSMAAGMPVVATACAAEGMHLSDGESVLLAEDADAFAAAVVRLHSDSTLWARLSGAGLDNIRRHFSFDAARRALDETFGPSS